MFWSGRNKYVVILALLFCSCQNRVVENAVQLVKEWNGKQLKFPSHSVFTIQGKDSVKFLKKYADYRILIYTDSAGCISCRLQLPRWKDFMDKIDSLSCNKVSFLYYFHPKDISELRFIFRRDKFDYPVCLDMDDSLNKLNHFPQNDVAFHTFLLDKNNRVLAIGNPIHNPKVKELYLKIIQGEKVGQVDENKVIRTKASIDRTSVSLGSFDWQEEQKATFVLKNVGDKPLAIQNVTTSCGCTTVTYPKEPALPGKEIALEVVYKAEHPEHFDKTITVYCNAENSPLVLKISGDAK